MEAYKTLCPKCNYVRYWTGYKTGLGKTKEQLEEMRREESTCINCGSDSAKTTVDRESPNGNIFAEMDESFVTLLQQIISPRR